MIRYHSYRTKSYRKIINFHIGFITIITEPIEAFINTYYVVQLYYNV